MLSVRPKVSQLTFNVFSRSIHPELYDVYASRDVEREKYSARIEVTNCGHVITWKTTPPSASEQFDSGSELENSGIQYATLCEVASAATQPLPTKRQLLGRNLKGSRTERVDHRLGINYRTHFQLETVKPDLFWMVHKQLDSGPVEGLIHRFEPSVRISMGALSYINIETRLRSMRIQAIHTFPDDYEIVKIESLFSIDPPQGD
ncbi:MAG: DUF2617 family protein [Planctomycetota bacterium]